MPKRQTPSPATLVPAADYDGLLRDVVSLLETARHTAARAVNAVMTATYWEVGRRIVEVEQRGRERADYGTRLIERLSGDLTKRFGRGFSRANLEYMRRFYEGWPIPQTPSGELVGGEAQTPSAESAPEKSQTPSGKLQTASATSVTTEGAPTEPVRRLAARFPLPWSHYVRLMSVKDDDARRFYEQEALRGGWTERQLDRQVASQFYERTLLSRNKAAMLRKGAVPQPGDQITPEEEIKDPLVLECLDV